MTIKLDLKENSYDIIIERGASNIAGELLNLSRKVLIVTDTGVPAKYAGKIADASTGQAFIYTIPCGEDSKSINNFKLILEFMLKHGFTRKDCVVAVGGGVVGDLAGFAASAYMRGIDFYNIPTTVLSQVDSSIGGKTAVNLNGIKNIVGAFYQPKRVLIDPDLLFTLPKRQISNGLAEALKMSLTCDAELFDIFENEDPFEKIDEIIYRSLLIKKSVVEKDEKEAGLRRVLNFGHTLGHGIESRLEPEVYHGECVALGMLPMCADGLRERVLAIYKKLELRSRAGFDIDGALDAIMHDKKSESGTIRTIRVDEPGSFYEKTISREEAAALLRIVQS